MRNLFSSDFVQGDCCRAVAAITATATTAIVAREADTTATATSDSYLETTFTAEKSSSNLIAATIESVATTEELGTTLVADFNAAA